MDNFRRDHTFYLFFQRLDIYMTKILGYFYFRKKILKILVILYKMKTSMVSIVLNSNSFASYLIQLYIPYIMILGINNTSETNFSM